MEQVSSEPSEEENKSLEGSSLERAFKADENDFKNNVTKEERHRLDEIKIDEQSINYSSSANLTTTPLPPATMKKGKYLELMPPSDDDNINASLPNGAEVWALASMRDMDGNRKITTSPSSTEDSSDVELLSPNDTAKSLLDWTEIARLDNETDLITTPSSSSTNDINLADDPATAENKEIAVSSVLPSSSTTVKSIIEDNRLELEHENAELPTAANKSVIDHEIFNKNRDESTSVEIIAPISEKKTENLEVASTTIESITTTIEAFTTVASEVEVTTSIVDTFTDESEENSEVFKRTITELPEIFSTSTQSPRTTTLTIIDEVPTTQETTSPSTIPSAEQLNTIVNARSTMVTKSISIRIATSTAEPTSTEGTSAINEETTTTQYDNTVESSSMSTIEIMDDDKFRYSTLLPESTTNVPPTVFRSIDSSKDGVESAVGGDAGNNVAVISIAVSVVVFLLLVAGGFVSGYIFLGERLFLNFFLIFRSCLKNERSN